MSTEARKSSKKVKPLKSIRGLITGKSRREKRKAKEEAQKQAKEAKSPAAPTLEEETVYGADFDTAAPTTAKSPKDASPPQAAAPLHIILLLMDPKTRRFELLQLEFDTAKATVSDILQQIPISATEESLRTQKFDCICNTEGVEYDQDKSLSDYVDGTAVVIAVPKTDLNGAENAAKMAKPILKDPKVEEMLESAGIKLKADDKEDSKEIENNESVQSEPSSTSNPDTSAVTTSASKSKEICGSAVSAATSSVRSITSAGTEAVSNILTRSILKKELPSTSGSSSNIDIFTIIVAGCVLAYITRILVMFDAQITKPLAPSDILKEGAWRSRCGLTSKLPRELFGMQLFDCKSAYIEMNMDGALQVVEDDEVVFLLLGKTCDEEEIDCEPGAAFGENGDVKIGGAAAKVGKKSTISLSPWPFESSIVPSKGRKAWF